MILYKGDTVKTKSGKTAEIIDVWGVARYWYKLKTTDGEIIYTMSENIVSIIKRQSKMNGGRRRA